LGVGEVQTCFNTAKLCYCLYAFEAQKITLEPIEILTHAELHGFHVGQVRFDRGDSGLNLSEDFRYKVRCSSEVPFPYRVPIVARKSG
jgi:hypothetical protein